MEKISYEQLNWVRKFDPHVHCRSPGKQSYKSTMMKTCEVLYRTGHAGGGLMVWNLDPPATTIEVIEECSKELRECMKKYPIRLVLMVGAPDDMSEDNHDGYTQFFEYCMENDDVACVCTDISGTMGSHARSMEYIDELFSAASFCNYKKLIKVHCEAPRFYQARQKHDEHRPTAAAQMGVYEVLKAAKESQRDWTLYLPHLSTVAELLLVQTANEEHTYTPRVHTEVTHQSVLVPAENQGKAFEQMDPQNLRFLLQQNPPLRSSVEQVALQQAETEGWTAGRASDHAPHTAEDKAGMMSGNPTLGGSPRAHCELISRVRVKRADELLFSNFVSLLHAPVQAQVRQRARELKRNVKTRKAKIQDCTREFWYDPYAGVLPPLEDMLTGTRR